MSVQETITIYKEMGIGSKEERNQFLQLYPETQNNKFIFIVDVPNTTPIKRVEK
ncbi:hypothetical protein [Pedobacter sp.]|uniref:hypothetical protein n=1 Tax=Pedobacter sp. TaxID=1411316 RepID=UPI00356289B0